MKTVKDIRSEFLGFFEKNGHEVVESGSLVPHNDPTLMFSNAGMNQFKDVFTGKETRPYTRATTAQKCVRAGGKHNDLENVGYTARHHTFFEMLGNFSFGDYFKEEAIVFAWELLTKNFDLPKEKLLITVHTSDEEAAGIWKKVSGFNDDKIIRIPTDDNFWRMGDTGPCGPCTEIFYDHGDHIWGGPPGSPEEDGDRFIEIWNNVFMQYEQIDPETRIELPAKSIDTGMGLERMAATLMGSNNNYDIDIMQALIQHVADITSVDPKGEHAASHKVIADHIRSASFLMADGVLPSNEGRGYVLRRIMRRGMRHAHLLGAKEPLMHKLFPTLLEKMGEAYPELSRASSLITQTLETEETKFKGTLERGLKMLDDETEKLSSGQKFSGETAFKLYDTYGFPLDLTQDALRNQNIEVDEDAFNACMNKQKEAARAAWSGSGEMATDAVWFDLAEEHGSTEFLGYDLNQAEASVIAILKDGAPVDSLKEGEQGQVLVNQTPFYGESGGQAGDCGTMDFNGGTCNVTTTLKPLGKLHAHIVSVKKGTLKVGNTVNLQINEEARQLTRANHSATHLLHSALRKALGDHVTQKGSLVNAEKLRFDFTHPKALTEEELHNIESLVNDEVMSNNEVKTKLMNKDDAVKAGAMALFGEKYDEEVRVLTMGSHPKDQPHAFSVELCGGTHAKRTGDIGLFKIVSEGAVSSGVRRLEAVTNKNALKFVNDQIALLSNTASNLKATAADLPSKVQSL
ncbi:MAG: alanine--tRNA ligase, partial [Bdellovibrionales bacterium]